MEFEIGDLVIDPDLGIGLVTEVIVDDNEIDGFIYLIFYAKVSEHVLEYAYELIPYCPGYRD